MYTYVVRSNYCLCTCVCLAAGNIHTKINAILYRINIVVIIRKWRVTWEFGKSNKFEKKNSQQLQYGGDTLVLVKCHKCPWSKNII